MGPVESPDCTILQYIYPQSGIRAILFGKQQQHNDNYTHFKILCTYVHCTGKYTYQVVLIYPVTSFIWEWKLFYVPLPNIRHLRFMEIFQMYLCQTKTAGVFDVVFVNIVT
jgi:hypothetical protein